MFPSTTPTTPTYPTSKSISPTPSSPSTSKSTSPTPSSPPTSKSTSPTPSTQSTSTSTSPTPFTVPKYDLCTSSECCVVLQGDFALQINYLQTNNKVSLVFITIFSNETDDLFKIDQPAYNLTFKNCNRSYFAINIELIFYK